MRPVAEGELAMRARQFFDLRSADRLLFQKAKAAGVDPTEIKYDNPDDPPPVPDPEPPPAPPHPPAAPLIYTASGSIGCGGLFFYGSINCDLNFEDGTHLNFQAEIGGLVPTPFSTTGAVSHFYHSPQELIDMQWVGVTVFYEVGVLHVVWNKDGRDIGSATGGGIVPMPGVAGGSGNFYRVY
jgi:hypothetical protein